MCERIEYRTAFDYSDMMRQIYEQANRLIDEQVVEQMRAMLAELGYRKYSECKERQGYYLDAETIQRQQERIAELERDGAALFYDDAYTRDALKELIRDLYRQLLNAYDAKELDGFAERMRELGTEVEEWVDDDIRANDVGHETCSVMRSFHYEDQYVWRDYWKFEMGCGGSFDWFDPEPPRFCPCCGKMVEESLKGEE